MIRNLVAQFVLSVLMLLTWTPTFGQQSYNLSGAQKLTVSGTSTIHDWEMVAKDNIKGTAELTVDNGKLKSIQSVVIDLPVKSLKSGKGAMDNNTYDALKEKKHPAIRFEMTEFIAATGDEVQIKGKLTIAGTEKIIFLKGTYSEIGNSIKFKGDHDIMFSEFKIDPPTAVFGTIKTGNELTLGFEIIFSPTN